MAKCGRIYYNMNSGMVENGVISMAMLLTAANTFTCDNELKLCEYCNLYYCPDCDWDDTCYCGHYCVECKCYEPENIAPWAKNRDENDS